MPLVIVETAEYTSEMEICLLLSLFILLKANSY